MTTLVRLTVVCLLVSLAFFAGCRKTSAPAPSVTPSPGAAVPLDQLHHPEGGAVSPSETRYFSGSIGTNLDLEMKLVRTGDQLAGSYLYKKVGTRIELRGNVDQDGNLTLEEFDNAGKQTGIFKGIWKLDPEDGLVTLAGNWSKPAGDKGSDKKTAFSIHQLPINFSGNVELITKQIKESNKKLKYEVAAEYPQLASPATPPADSSTLNPNFEKFNQAVRASVMKKIAEFKKDLVSPEEGEQPVETMGSDISISYTVALAQDDLVSIDFEIGSYYSGAAHPNSYSEVINYDLKNGKELKLGDLFKPGSRYLAAMSAYSISDLKKQSKAKGPDGMLDDSSIESGAGPASKNFGSWTITKKGLGINFDAYQVGPYAAGPQYVLIPYSALKDLIAPDGPIGQFVK
jgi:hypothetical protein